VERFLRTLSEDLLGTLPGASLGHFYKRKNEKHPKEFAVIDMARLQEIIHIWIVDIYHNHIHRGIRTTPYQAWMDRRGFSEIELPNSPEELDRICCEITTRSIFHYGIELHGARGFNNRRLQQIRETLEHTGAIKVRVRWSDEKLSHCWVEDPRTNEWFVVPNRNPETRDLSRLQIYMLNKVVRLADSQGEHIKVAEARRRIRAMADGLSSSKRMRDRNRALGILGAIDGDSGNSPLTPEDDSMSSTKKAKPRPRTQMKKRPPPDDMPIVQEIVPSNPPGRPPVFARV
jgi:putative transposase